MLGLKFKKSIIAVAVVVSCMTALVACTEDSADQEQEPKLTGGVAATVNGVEILEDDVTTQVQNFRKAQGYESEEDWGTFLSQYSYTPEQWREEAINGFVDNELIKQAAEEEGIDISAEIDPIVSTSKERYEGDAWIETLETAGYTEATYRLAVENALWKQRLKDKLYPKEEIEETIPGDTTGDTTGGDTTGDGVADDGTADDGTTGDTSDEVANEATDEDAAADAAAAGEDVPQDDATASGGTDEAAVDGSAEGAEGDGAATDGTADDASADGTTDDGTATDGTTEEETVEVTDEDILAKLREDIDKYNGARRSSHILFEESDEALAQETLDKIRNGELDFVEAVKEHSTDEGSAAQDGDVSWDVLTTFVQEYADALKALEKDQVSDLVKSEFGYHIIKCTDLFTAPEEITGLDQFPTEIVDSVRTELSTPVSADEEQETLFTEWLTKRNEESEIVINDMPEGLPYAVDMSKYGVTDDGSAEEDVVLEDPEATDASEDAGGDTGEAAGEDTASEEVPVEDGEAVEDTGEEVVDPEASVEESTESEAS